MHVHVGLDVFPCLLTLLSSSQHVSLGRWFPVNAILKNKA